MPLAIYARFGAGDMPTALLLFCRSARRVADRAARRAGGWALEYAVDSEPGHRGICPSFMDLASRIPGAAAGESLGSLVSGCVSVTTSR